MTDEEIIELGTKAGLCNDNGEDDDCYNVIPQMRKFAKFVAAVEREACAKVCEDIDTEYEGEDVLATWCAAAIRARGTE